MMRKLFNFLAAFLLLSLASFAGVLLYSKDSLLTFLTRPYPVANGNYTFSWRIKDVQQLWVKGSEDPKVSQEMTHIAAPTNKTLGPCTDPPPKLVGPLQVEFNFKLTLEEVRKEISRPLREGGRYKPPDCIAIQKVAIIIPFRNRHEHLKHWLYYLHPILMRQQLDYDLVPLDDRNIYKCFDNPRHLAVAMDKFNFRLPYKTYFGGVSSLFKDQYLKINGFPNTYWGWGGEDDDIYKRIVFRGMSISRPDSETGRYKMIKHNRDLHNEANPKNPDKLRHTQRTMDEDGINSLKYTVKEIVKDALYTFITVDIQAPAS
ncbi:beta-1,4-galactosyltransferase 2-like isoform X2 [Amphiprion ocellaris]|uniref:beta-1,4-galactosyltransferase 2-like isoform X2 n=1 Tax=Amphiprion ocellaris TaxID=80972 RepID=UPI00241120D2|nr:beta-1,4-galactosyltransferase 2-like isoform X2 [Amphiprion ocellaris]